MYQPWNNKKPGFTIVELLIVIVVIAVLAAITILAYNGIQTRARNTQTVSSLTNYTRAIRGFYSTNQRFPGPIYTVSCLGKAGTLCGNVTDGTSDCNGLGPASYVAAFGTDINSITTTLPEPSNQTLTCGGKLYSGVIYVNYGTLVLLYAYFNGISSCQTIGGATIYAAGTGPNGSGYLCTYQIDA